MKHSTIAIVGKQEQVPRAASLGVLARLLPGVCIAIGITLFFWPNNGEPKAVPSQAVNHLASSSARTRPIETMCVGDRVLAHNPEVSQSERDTFVEPDWSEWLHVSLAMPKPDGSLLEIELLRPETWVRKQMGLIVESAKLKSIGLSPLAASSGAAKHVATPLVETSEIAIENDGWRDNRTHVDSVPYSPLLPILRDIALAGAELQLSGEELQAIFVEMDLPELAITGEAIVLDIRGPPSIRPGAGRVVTATFHHSSGDVIDLVVGDLSGKALASVFSDTPTIAASNEHASDYRSQATDTIGTTSNHPFWSLDRQAYVQAGQLRIGERLHTYSGDTKRVISRLARPGPQPVYNLEVFAEHVYYVGHDGLLVHNSYVAPNPAIADEVAALRRIAANNRTSSGAVVSDVGRGVRGNQLTDRIAGEIQGAVNQAERVLQAGGSGGTRWGAIYQRLNGRGHWLEPIARGNAIQQIAETRLLNNAYLQEAGVIFNRGHVLGLRNNAGNLLRPDFQVPLSNSRVGVFDITTPGQASKIFKYSTDATRQQVPQLINITY